MSVFKPGDRVVYTQGYIRHHGVCKEWAESVGTVYYSDIIDGHECAGVHWDFAPSTPFWVRVDFLVIAKEKP